LPDSIYGCINYLLNKLLYLCRLSLAALYLWQTLSIAMKELPHGFPLMQRGPFVSVTPLRHELINCFRLSPVMRVAVLHSLLLRSDLGRPLAPLPRSALAALPSVIGGQRQRIHRTLSLDHESSSHRTLRWREMDSNFRFRAFLSLRSSSVFSMPRQLSFFSLTRAHARAARVMSKRSAGS
jgi:hypothetical protein